MVISDQATIPEGRGELRFAANLKWLFSDLPMEARIATAAANGFRAVEYPNPYEHSVGDFGRMLRDGGVELAMINTPPRTVDGRTRTGIACDPQLRREFRDGVSRGLEYATGLDAPLLHVVGGPVPDGVPFDRAWAEFLINVAWAVDAAGGTGVSLLIEPQNALSSPGFVLTTQAQAVAAIEAIGSERLRLLFDVFHVQVQEGGVSAKLKEFAPHLGHVQIADSPGRTEPGTGELSWSHVFGVLRDIGYEGWIGCEYTATAAQGSTVAWLKSLEGGRR